MRKENSKFKMAFLSHEGTRLFNNDNYGSAELDEYACYVLADGIEDGARQSDSAKMAVDAAIAAFIERPSIKKRHIKKYIRAAHEALARNADRLKLKASITVVVTDYQKIRYGHVGNTRFYLYRNGRLLEESRDHSLSWQMMEKKDLPKDKIAKHEERGNLTRYLGQSGNLHPEISKKIKLLDGDILTLLTRGIWEHCDSEDIKAALDSAENEPELALGGIERLILDPKPDEIDNYTVATVFVDKIFVDPNRAKRIRRIVTVAVIVVVAIAVIVVVLLVLSHQRRDKEEKLQYSYLNAIEYMTDHNYIRAQEEFGAALELAVDLKDYSRRDSIGNYQKLAESISNADDLFSSGSYEDAEEAYLTAQSRSRFTDNFSADYIASRLARVGRYINVDDLLSLGDAAMDNGEYKIAETNYTEARRAAAELNYVDGKKQAMESLTLLYEKMSGADQESQEASQSQADLAVTAAQLEAQGDQAVQNGDMTGAKLYYGMVREKYVELSDEASVGRVDEKLANVGEKQQEEENQKSAAEKYMAEGDRLFKAQEYAEAKAQYIYARNIYSRLNDESKLLDVRGKIETVEAYIVRR